MPLIRSLPDPGRKPALHVRDCFMNNYDNDRMILFTDIDETLVNTDKSLSRENLLALERFLDMGNIISISTGRALEGAAWLMKDLGLYGRKNMLITSYNGGLIFDTYSEEVLLKKTVPLDLMYRAFDLAREYGIHIQAYTDRAVVSETDNHHLRKYLSIQKLDVVFTDDIRSFSMEPSVKLLCLDFDDPSRITQFRRLFEAEFAGKLNCFNSNPYLLEIVPPGVDKGAALRFIAEHYQIPIRNTISAGDAENDIPMIRAAGIGCAVNNANDSLKAEADYITERDNNHAAVAEILDRFCFSRT